MMTKEERINLRKWCLGEQSNNSVFVSGWARDTVELIDTLNETETLLAANREELRQMDANSAEKDREYKRRLEELESELERYKHTAKLYRAMKKRAEALKKALLESCEYGACEFCEHERKEDISCTLAECADKNNKLFKFDAERFTMGGDGE